MKRRSGLLALVLGLLLAAPAGAPAQAVAAGPVTSPLSRAGKWIVDDEGRVAIVHGVNIVRKFAPFYPNNFTDQDARFLASAGLTAARIGFIWQGVEPRPGQYDDAYIRRVIAFNDLLSRYGIRTLIDFHQDVWGASAGFISGDGAPAWATLGSNALDDFQHFWNDDPAPDGVGIQTHFINAWRHVASMLDSSARAANILGLDPFNEPYAGTNTACAPFTPCPTFESGALAGFYRRVIAAIRSTGDTHVVFPEGIAQNGILPPSLPKFGDPGTAFTFHYYCPVTQNATSSSPADAGCEPGEQRGIGNFVSYADRLDVPALLGEFSCNDADDDNAAMVDLADRDFLSWTIWMYYSYRQDPANCAGQGLLTDDTKPGSASNVKQAKLEAIVVPYPQAIAGTPGSFGFDRSTDTMNLTYEAKPVPGAGLAPEATTQVFVPQLKYPHGYRVTVSGAQVVSPPTSPWVELRANRGARVSLSISPATDSVTQLPPASASSFGPGPKAACAGRAFPARRRWLGPVRLGMTRAQARRQVAPGSLRARRYADLLCPGQDAIQAIYPSPRVLTALSARARRRVRGRVVLILTSSRTYALRGLRAGTEVKAARHILHAGPLRRVASGGWYLVGEGRLRGVLKVRRRRIAEIGIGDPRLTSNRSAIQALLPSR